MDSALNRRNGQSLAMPRLKPKPQTAGYPEPFGADAVRAVEFKVSPSSSPFNRSVASLTDLLAPLLGGHCILPYGVNIQWSQ